jgi:hypothetical protein
MCLVPGGHRWPGATGARKETAQVKFQSSVRCHTAAKEIFRHYVQNA